MNLQGDVNKTVKSVGAAVEETVSGINKKIKDKQLAKIDKLKKYIKGMKKKEKDVILVLKDFHTITAVSDETIYCNLFGNPGMATAGSGDVLAGMIGGLLAQKLEPKEAAPLGVACHGYLGDLAAERVGMRGLMAGDLLNGD